MSAANIVRYFTPHETTIGTLMIVASPRGLQRIGLLKANERSEDFLKQHYGESAASIVPLSGFFTTVCAAIDSYLSDGSALKLPIDLCGGTPLQRAVWFKIATIPHGQTISYSELAAKVGFPRAVRAVASACAANPIPLIIPCHRVVAKDGTPGGFSLGGLRIKETLLALEASASSSQAA